MKIRGCARAVLGPVAGVKVSSSVNNLFLDDYMDQGSIAWKRSADFNYSDNFFLLWGNHECTSINQIYGVL